MRLLIVSHTEHYRAGDHVAGWGATVRELDHLAQLFDEIVHVAPLYPGVPPKNALPYSAGNIRLRPVNPTGGANLTDKLRILATYPDYARVIREEMARADAVHVRCPANISLLALYLLSRAEQPLYRWVKYAGNWRPTGGDSRSYALQRRWLQHNRPRGVVTVNGRWPGQPAHIYTFDNPSLTEEEYASGQEVARNKRLTSPVELLFVGALNDAKGVGRVLEMGLELQRRGVSFQLRFVGDGVDRARYEAWTVTHGLRNVSFYGWRSPAEVAQFGAAAHFILLPTLSSEGWPKVLSEAMSRGAVPIASTVSSIPQVLDEIGAGVAVPAGDIQGAADAIVRYLDAPDTWLTASQAGAAAAYRFTYRAYQAAVARLFDKVWGVCLPAPMAGNMCQDGR
ncbi:MAG: glycosyltransferase [Anaerolineae bacterium]|nr:glycosyltransferase [Anaerolineae bacterium]